MSKKSYKNKDGQRQGCKRHAPDLQGFSRSGCARQRPWPRSLVLESYGQHNIGMRLGTPDYPIHIQITGPVGQRLGCMGLPGTTIVCEGPASDDVGYLNIGADIIVKGDATNGVCNAMADGRVMIGGSIGARGLTMTKWNPEHARPEMWVLGSVGDTFAEFNCGGIAVVCGVEPEKSGQCPRLPALRRHGRRLDLFPRQDRRQLFPHQCQAHRAATTSNGSGCIERLPEFLQGHRPGQNC